MCALCLSSVFRVLLELRSCIILHEFCLLMTVSTPVLAMFAGCLPCVHSACFCPLNRTRYAISVSTLTEIEKKSLCRNLSALQRTDELRVFQHASRVSAHT